MDAFHVENEEALQFKFHLCKCDRAIVMQVLLQCILSYLYLLLHL